MRARDSRSTSPGWPLHGGQPGPLLARFGLAEETPVLDVSANLNPLGPPAWLHGWLMARLGEPEALARYPDPGYAEAHAAIAAHEGVATEQVLLTNGGAEAIFLAAALQAREWPGAAAAIIEPTFAEYARACAAHGLPVQRLPLAPPDFRLDVEAIVAGLGEARLLWLCRPNNPTATLVPRADLERLLTLTAARGCRLVVDEAFVDFIGPPGESLTSLLADHPHLLLLRSMTKCFTLPGLRLGYLLGAPEAVATARACQPAWSVNALAAALVAPLLADLDFARRTEGWLAAERPRLQAGLEALGLEVVPSRANFFLVRHPAGREATRCLLPALLRRGVLARHTESFAGLDGGWLRLALRDAEDNESLLAALDEALVEVGRPEVPR
ncbi:L-threonine O-3-phosphate decarboxylase [Halomonas shengliensis]|uniref:threonine-phosphate decarboxylase n=1 Tax=Halomonas shengliensis TaxID=419597 RepID=A0A1H0IK23_9GAMM|nr:threonine-phosphate decarboxylase CobD [Halomonas shengliensis]SDO31814.1 L-threonine O-3-phosphate decarboxylase [Halomonas shengliensis]